MRVTQLRGWWIVPLLAVSSLGLSAVAWAQAGAARDVSLVEVVKTGDTAAVRSLLEQQVDVNTPEVDGTTALHWAVHRDALDIVDLLLRAGADVRSANRYGVEPLALAGTNGNAAMTERLLDAGADPNSASPEGQTALMTAARTGNVGTVKLLLAHGADVDATESYRQQTALMWAAAQGHPVTVRALIEAGADIHARSKGNPRSVRAAVRRGVSQFALNAGTGESSGREKTAAAAPPGFTPLLFAVRAGHIDAARVLLEAGANVNDMVGDGASALLLAVINAHYELANVLLEQGADPNADTQGWTALHQLVWTRKPNLLRPLPFPLPTGTLSDLDLVKVLVAHGADPNARQKAEPRDGNRNVLNRIGATPFLLAAKAADADMMRVLLENGADPQLATEDGVPPLMAAAGVGIWRIGENVGTNVEALEAVKLAWELGNDVNAVDVNNDTALHGAVHRGRECHRAVPDRQGRRPRRGEHLRVDAVDNRGGRLVPEHLQERARNGGAAASTGCHQPWPASPRRLSPYGDSGPSRGRRCRRRPVPAAATRQPADATEQHRQPAVAATIATTRTGRTTTATAAGGGGGTPAASIAVTLVGSGITARGARLRTRDGLGRPVWFRSVEWRGRRSRS